MKQNFLNAVIPPGAWGGIGDSILLSYFHWKDHLEPPAAKLVAGDSGGFSVATLGIELDAREVILWQIEHCDLGYILDRPPYVASTTHGTARLDRELWPDALALTLSNVRRAARYYRPQVEPFRWWGIIQGGTREQHEEWYGEVAAVYPFTRDGEGWAMRPYPNSDLRSIARCVLFAADKQIKNLHLLQTTGQKAVAVLLGLAQIAGLEHVTYDSASPGRLAKNMWCLRVPDDYPVFERDDLREVSADEGTDIQDYMRSGACRCSGCKAFPARGAPPPTEYVRRLAVHNHTVMRANFDAMAAEAEKDPQQLIRMAAGESADAVFRAFDGS